MIRGTALLLVFNAAACAGDLWIQVLRDGKPVPDLKPADIQVIEQTTRRPAASLERLALPLDVVFIVEQRRWEPLDQSIRNAVMLLTEGLRADETAGLLTAGTEVRTVVKAGKVPPDFYRELGGLKGPRWFHGIGGPEPVTAGANLLDAIVVACRQLDEVSAAGRRRAIVIVSQNLAGPESTSAVDAIRAAQNSNTIVTLLSFPEESPVPAGGPNSQEWVLMRFPRRPPPPTAGQPLDDIVATTGGELVTHAKSKKLRQHIDNLRTRYKVGYQQDAPLAPVQVELTPNGRVAHSNVTLHYPKPLHPPN